MSYVCVWAPQATGHGVDDGCPRSIFFSNNPNPRQNRQNATSSIGKKKREVTGGRGKKSSLSRVKHMVARSSQRNVADVSIVGATDTIEKVGGGFPFNPRSILNNALHTH